MKQAGNIKKPSILISNDDGVYAKGLQVLSDYVANIATIDVVAPDRNRSGASNSLTLAAPLRIKQIAPRVISVEGTPTDCVHLAITGILPKLPDMVISGINEGSNLGDDVWYSGTVAAAMEGRFLGLPAIALSLAGEKPQHYETAARIAQLLIGQILRDPLPANTILNVNIPDVPFDELMGFEITRLGTRHRAETIMPQYDPRGLPIYWIGQAGPEADAGVGTDFNAVRCGNVSITPLRTDITHYEAFEQLSGWVKGLQ